MKRALSTTPFNDIFEEDVLSSAEMKSVLGGDELWDLLNNLWNATPEGGSYTFSPNNNGTWNQMSVVQNIQPDPYGGGTSLPAVVVSDTQPTISHYYSTYYSQTNLIFGHNAGKEWVQSLKDSLGSSSIGYGAILAGIIPGLNAYITSAFGLLLTNLTSTGGKLDQILAAINNMSGNIEIIIGSVNSGVPGAGGTFYTFRDAATGADLGGFSF